MIKFITILSIFTIMASNSFMSQTTFDVQTTDTTFFGSASQSDFYGDVDLYNNTGSNLPMTWVADFIDLPSGWEFSICDPAVCNLIGVTQDDWTLSASDGYLNIHFYPNGVDGTGVVRLHVYETNNSSEESWITFTGTTENLSVQSESLSDVNSVIQQNGSNVNIVVRGLDNYKGTVSLYNLNGVRFVENIFGRDNLVNLSIHDLSPGIYLLSIQTSDNKSFTQKFVVK